MLYFIFPNVVLRNKKARAEGFSVEPLSTVYSLITEKLFRSFIFVIKNYRYFKAVKSILYVSVHYNIPTKSNPGTNVFSPGVHFAGQT